MPRQPRLNLANIPQHVIQRGNNRQVCFFAKQDYTVYLAKLHEYSLQHNVAIHAFILMTNHVHLLVTPKTTDGVSKLMQSVGRYYVMYINRNYNRSGTLWEGRFKSCLVGSDNYCLTVSRYIELNPVRAKMVKHPADYPWSSFHANGLGKSIKLLTPHQSYLALNPNSRLRMSTYRALFEQLIPQSTIEQIRDAANKHLLLGDKQFRHQIECQLGTKLCEPLSKGGDRKSKLFRDNRNQRI